MIKLMPLAANLYKAYRKASLQSRLKRYTRDLQVIAAQRENDFHAERMLHREVVEVRSKLHAL